MLGTEPESADMQPPSVASIRNIAPDRFMASPCHLVILGLSWIYSVRARTELSTNSEKLAHVLLALSPAGRVCLPERVFRQRVSRAKLSGHGPSPAFPALP